MRARRDDRRELVSENKLCQAEQATTGRDAKAGPPAARTGFDSSLADAGLPGKQLKCSEAALLGYKQTKERSRAVCVARVRKNKSGYEVALKKGQIGPGVGHEDVLAYREHADRGVGTTCHATDPAAG